MYLCRRRRGVDGVRVAVYQVDALRVGSGITGAGSLSVPERVDVYCKVYELYISADNSTPGYNLLMPICRKISILGH